MLEFFGQFLVRTKVISVEQLRDALDMMSRENLLLGQLAVEEGYLSESQANTINREQRYSDKPFGAIGVQMGLLTTEQLDQLLELQNKRRVQVGEAQFRLFLRSSCPRVTTFQSRSGTTAYQGGYPARLSQQSPGCRVSLRPGPSRYAANKPGAV